MVAVPMPDKKRLKGEQWFVLLLVCEVSTIVAWSSFDGCSMQQDICPGLFPFQVAREQGELMPELTLFFLFSLFAQNYDMDFSQMSSQILTEVCLFNALGISLAC